MLNMKGYILKNFAIESNENNEDFLKHFYFFYLFSSKYLTCVYLYGIKTEKLDKFNLKISSKH